MINRLKVLVHTICLSTAEIHQGSGASALPEPWVFGFHQLADDVTQKVHPLLARVRDMALRVPGELRTVGKELVL
jgi:hypothetical protein